MKKQHLTGADLPYRQGKTGEMGHASLETETKRAGEGQDDLALGGGGVCKMWGEVGEGLRDI